MKIRFIIYGLVGWCLEIIWNGIGSFINGDITLTGYSSIWMFPIYGMLILLEPIHNRIRYMPFFIRGGVYTVLIFFIELTSGSLFRSILGTCPWNYGTDVYSIYGLITLKYIPVWFTFGLLFEILHDFLIRWDIGSKKMIGK